MFCVNVTSLCMKKVVRKQFPSGLIKFSGSDSDKKKKIITSNTWEKNTKQTLIFYSMSTYQTLNMFCFCFLTEYEYINSKLIMISFHSFPLFL